MPGTKSRAGELTTHMEKHRSAKLRKLMELASRNPSQAEAEAAALAAQRLALRSGLDGDDPPEASARDAVREVTTPPASRLPWWARRLAVIVAENFACEALLRRLEGRQSIAFIGVRDAPKAACFAFLELSHAHAAARRAFGRSQSASATQNDFTRGFLGGVESRLRGQAQSEALAVLTPPEVRAYVEEHDPAASRTVRIRSAFDETAWSEGFRAGQRAGRRERRLGSAPRQEGE